MYSEHPRPIANSQTALVPSTQRAEAALTKPPFGSKKADWKQTCHALAIFVFSLTHSCSSKTSILISVLIEKYERANWGCDLRLASSQQSKQVHSSLPSQRSGISYRMRSAR